MTMSQPMKPGQSIEVQLITGHEITLTARHEGDYRVTVMRMAQHVEHPRHFPTEQLARQHARGLTISYRPTGSAIRTIAA